MTDPTLPKMFATAFPVPHPQRLDQSRPTYWRLTSAAGRQVFVVCTLAELDQWIDELFGDDKFGGVFTKLRTAVGQPPY